MLAILELEFIGENWHSYRKRAQERHEGTERYGAYLGPDKSRPWVARIIGRNLDTGQLLREFMRGQIDYSRTNSTGSRGVRLYFALDDGVYEINARETWQHTRRYFVRVTDGQYQEIAREEVLEWLANSILE